MAILCILEGVRPKTPIFAATRGYTDKLWEMTTSCWKEDPSDRPTVDHVLALLENAAEESRSYAQLTLEWMVNQILDRARLPMGEDEAWDVVETLEETVSRKQFPPTCACVPNQRTADAGNPRPDEPAYEVSMFPGTREDLRRTWHPPRLIHHPRIQVPEAG